MLMVRFHLTKFKVAQHSSEILGPI
uniref:Uncharacterized protein n=1 Tax=Rhizophora mucronata TaxID=61149 RepID=A0A2P2QJB5_RHIMU